MYEISLVPEVKAQLLKKIRLKNLVVLICIGISIACALILCILGSITGARSAHVAAQDSQISCLYDGTPGKTEKGKKPKSAKCKNNGTPIMKFNNLETLLTVQDQLKTIDTLNKSKFKFSRIFGLIDVLALNDPTGAEINLNELSVDFASSTLNFSGVAIDNTPNMSIGHRALQAFKGSVNLMYYDHGEYMRLDKDTGNYEVIPHFCMTSEVIDNIEYGIYHRGMPGCEAPLIDKLDGVADESESDDEQSKDEETDKKAEKKVEREDIYIRRTYNTSDEREKTKEGKEWLAGKKIEKGYYFESKCIEYDTDGKFDEGATLEKCKLVADPDSFVIDADSGVGDKRDDGEVAGNRSKVSFEASLKVAKDIFSVQNHNVMIASPSRRNVTDSYVQIRDMFTPGATQIAGEGKGKDGE